MKKYLWIFLLLPSLCFSATGDLETIGGKVDTAITSIAGKAGTAIASISGKNYTDGDASGQDFTDAFGSDTSANWTAAIGSFTITGGVMRDDNAAWDPALYVYETATDTVNQYVRVTMASASGSYPVIAFRVQQVGASAAFYGLEISYNYCELAWKKYANAADIGGGTSIATGDFGTCTAGQALGVTITGTGNDTVVRGWNNVTANAPDSASSWDSDETPDVILTTDPGANAVDTGNYVAIGGAQNAQYAITFDNFAGGDL